MNRTVQGLERQASALQERLSGGRRPIGLLLGAGCPLAARSKGRSIRAEKRVLATSAKNRAERALGVAEAFNAFSGVIRTRSRREMSRWWMHSAKHLLVLPSSVVTRPERLTQFRLANQLRLRPLGEPING